jgi:hypothetical protein
MYREKNILKDNYNRNNFTFFNIFKDLYPNTTEFLVDVILYVVIVVNILTILFFTIVKNVEKEIIQTQIFNLLDSIFIIDKNTFSGNVLYENLIKKINSVQIKQEEEEKIKTHNDKIFRNSMIFLLITNIIGIASLFVLWKYQKFDILYYLKKNSILGILVIFTEILFLYIISKNYIYIDRKYIFKTIQQKILKNN